MADEDELMATKVHAMLEGTECEHKHSKESVNGTSYLVSSCLSDCAIAIDIVCASGRVTYKLWPAPAQDVGALAHFACN